MMNDEKYVTYLTKNGLTELEAELQHLITVRRAEVAERLHQAQEDGDLLENAEYEAAKNEQSFVEGRIVDIQAMLSKAAVIKKGKVDGVAKLGSTVMVQENGLAVESYVIVGAAEAKPTAGLISNESPLGQALLGSKAGDKVVVAAPGGDLTFLVTKIK
ncbi:MAG: transcription elongation factor GreA [Anaerolineales bacterium]|jgi:transcription elongation factor GreA|nr:transcription elongation factor GreA [Anaerolineales bacterium]HJL69453.1 transcription elongation factor GreA [Anaerolineales bacterium]HJN40778.1 transcription elongation factor GreA [Anaerolineales bacterium]|tara:strand:+ start:9597 stop:10073 length:477 start_codon:yes stop_codon:yes gene_type:complete